MKQAIGITVHYDDQTTLKVPVAGFQINIGAAGGQSRYDYINADACPIHGAWKAIAAGRNETKGTSWNAFWTCDTEQGAPRCNNKPGREWVETHPPGGPDQAPTPEPSGAASDGDFDSLPF